MMFAGPTEPHRKSGVQGPATKEYTNIRGIAPVFPTDPGNSPAGRGQPRSTTGGDTSYGNRSRRKLSGGGVADHPGRRPWRGSQSHTGGDTGSDWEIADDGREVEYS
jgi:hypothetical protein